MKSIIVFLNLLLLIFFSSQVQASLYSCTTTNPQISEVNLFPLTLKINVLYEALEAPSYMYSLHTTINRALIARCEKHPGKLSYPQNRLFSGNAFYYQIEGFQIDTEECHFEHPGYQILFSARSAALSLLKWNCIRQPNPDSTPHPNAPQISY